METDGASMGIGWQPRIMPVKYPTNTGKPQRISGLEWRYGAGKIKYPAHLKNKWPFKMLYAQTADFTNDLALLRYDDALDTVAMTQYVVHSKGVRAAKPRPDRTTLTEQIKTGRSLIRGIPILSGINSNELTNEQLAILMDKHYAKMRNSSRSRNRNFNHMNRRRCHVVDTGFPIF
jgi:hypothetical protein